MHRSVLVLLCLLLAPVLHAEGMSDATTEPSLLMRILRGSLGLGFLLFLE